MSRSHEKIYRDSICRYAVYDVLLVFVGDVQMKLHEVVLAYEDEWGSCEAVEWRAAA